MKWLSKRWASKRWVSDWVTSIEGRELKRWREEAGESEEMSLDYYEVIRKEAANTRLEEPVHAHCHCHGVEFWITPPNEASFTAKSFVADLILPYRLNSPLSRKYGSHWWLTNNNARYLAGTCACLSCRSASGFDITFWAFIPNANIFLDAACTQSFPPYTSEHRNQYWGTMKTYQSSEGVTRTFCGRCGANVFWDGGEEKGRDGLIDVAVGLLDAKSGARAEELLGWCADRVSFEECAVNRGLVEALEKGLRDWAERVEGRGVSAWYNSWDHMHKVI